MPSFLTPDSRPRRGWHPSRWPSQSWRPARMVTLFDPFHRLTAFPGNLVSHGAGWILVRPWIPVAGDALAHLHHREHPAHFDRAELAFSSHHRYRVARSAHIHHVAHSFSSHAHVAGKQRADLS